MANTFYHRSTILIEIFSYIFTTISMVNLLCLVTYVKKLNRMKHNFVPALSTKMNRLLFLFGCFLLVFSTFHSLQAQAARGTKIGYIDMEYILEKTPNYQQAISQIEQKAQKWKQEIEEKEAEIKRQKDNLKTEQILLTKELIDEKEEEIAILEAELYDYRQKRFGPNGDFFVQKAVLIKPIQDQVFTIVQDIAETRKYDFVFDKASDLTMLFAAKRFDISDLVVRQITRADKREQMSKKQLEQLQKEEYKEDIEDANPALAERRRMLEQRKAERDKLMEDRKLAAEQKKKEQEEARQKLIDERNGKKTGTVSDKKDLEVSDKKNESEPKNTSEAKPSNDDREEKLKAAEEAKKKNLEERQRQIEERKKQIQEAKDKLQKEREEKLKQRQNNNPNEN